MYGERLIITFRLAVAVATMSGCYGEELELKIAGGTLPSALYYSSAVYDGRDSVFIFGGYFII
jgi:hypothetical protein